ncbi:MAG: mannonate dehydratase [Gemmatimonadetes bacterium]|jgi:mannonate dehydratase|nr:mannonate dehydratase [Gemmatimonadota bacterium]MBT6149213.1 mannonate dehydratase [Gemmatimonadota bacterium]MBT7863042.1 mannonate dehydratase [Gemmatimonadota bacterium]
MYIGTQGTFTEDHDLEMLAQLGVNNVDTTPTEPKAEWTTDLLTSYRERCAKFGINLEMMHLLGSSGAYHDKETGAIFLKPSDERERQLDLVCDLIRMAGEAGLRGFNYNITPLGHLRTESEKGRGGARLSTFDYEELLATGGNQPGKQLVEFEDGPADGDEMWSRIDHWLKRVIPVAEEYKVQMACHPSDPGIGVGEIYRGVDRVLGMSEGFKKLIDLYDSDYNGLNFCVGCHSECLEDPSKDIFDTIRYFGERKRIFNIHFRNIKGGFRKFVEVFPDEGDVDMIEVMRVLKAVDYPYMIMPDHVPGISGPEPGRVGFAFCFGYIHAALQAAGVK